MEWELNVDLYMFRGTVIQAVTNSAQQKCLGDLHVGLSRI
jgi:hypothetical protein